MGFCGAWVLSSWVGVYFVSFIYSGVAPLKPGIFWTTRGWNIYLSVEYGLSPSTDSVQVYVPSTVEFLGCFIGINERCVVNGPALPGLDPSELRGVLSGEYFSFYKVFSGK
jgi:hypothetical protein